MTIAEERYHSLSVAKGEANGADHLAVLRGLLNIGRGDPPNRSRPKSTSCNHWKLMPIPVSSRTH